MWNTFLQSQITDLKTNLIHTPLVLLLSSLYAPFIRPLNKVTTGSLGCLLHMADCGKFPALCKKALHGLRKILLSSRKGLGFWLEIMILKRTVLTTDTDVIQCKSISSTEAAVTLSSENSFWIIRNIILYYGRILLHTKGQETTA